MSGVTTQTLAEMTDQILTAQQAHERAGHIADASAAGWVVYCTCGRGFYDVDSTMAGNRWRVHQAVERGERLPVGLAWPT